MTLEQELKFNRELEIVIFYNLAKKYGFDGQPDCINCDQWFEGPYANCSRCS